MVRSMVMALLTVAYCTDSASAAPCGAGMRSAARVSSANYVIAFRTAPAKIAVGKHFAVEFMVCPAAGAVMPQVVSIDAFMPEHGHGMNYRATIKAAGDARWRAEGLMFHMPGRWDLIFELQGAGQVERLTRSITIE